MVSPAFLPSSDGRRYPTRGIGPYPPAYQERRGSSFPTHELRSNMSSGTGKETLEDASSAQRKRIAVACGRCRKRKIRCSGDDGSGQPCTNCKNAGHEPCQYLRVSSQETTLRADGFSYAIDLSRQFQARGNSGPSMLSTVGHYEGIPVGEDVPYRQSSTYPYNSKQYYQVPGYATGYQADDTTAECAMYSPYHSVQEPGYMVGYRLGSAPAGIKTSGVYVEPDPDYGFSTGPPPPQPPTMMHRGAHGAEAAGFSYPGVSVDAVSLQSHNERLTPPRSRPGALTGTTQYMYRNHSMSPAYAKHSQASTSSTPSTTSPTGEQTGYSSYDTSGVASSSSSSSYPLASPLRSQNDMYTTSSSSPGEAMMSHPPVSPQRPGAPTAEMTYRYADTTRQATGPAPAMVMGAGPHGYMPHNHGHHGSYMGPVEHCEVVGSEDEMSHERKPSRPSLRA